MNGACALNIGDERSSALVLFFVVFVQAAPRFLNTCRQASWQASWFLLRHECWRPDKNLNRDRPR
jgi:hypothetical protein